MNPLLHASTLPLGLPDFAAISPEHLAPALDAGMAEHRAEVAAIAADPAPPTFVNTLVPLERSGALLDRAMTVLGALVANRSTDELRAIDAAYSPLLCAHHDAVTLDPAVFARIEAIHQSLPTTTGLTPEDRRLVERHHRDRVLAGARLDEAGRARLTELNQRIAALQTRFEQLLLRSAESRALLVDRADELDGLSADAIAAAADAAERAGHPGRYQLALVLPTGQPALARLTRRATRQALLAASTGRGGPHDPDTDTGPVLRELTAVRAERAGLLGFAGHADSVVADQTAGSVEAIDDFLSRLVGPARVVADAERAELVALAAADGIDDFAAHDWAFYAQRARGRRHQVDAAALREYFKLDTVLQEGVFAAAERLYGIRMVERPDLVGHTAQARVWEVRQQAAPGADDEQTIGLFVGDFFAREGKRGGAWMNSLVLQSDLLGDKPVVTNNLNIAPPAPGQPVLLTLDEVRTAFHEFGHALHGLFSRVRYPRLSGTAVPRDIVEYPSQVNELWMYWPELLPRFARSVVTGEPLPPAQVAAVLAASRDGSGYRMVEMLGATLLDLAWHRLAPGEQVDDVDAFEAAALERAGIADPHIPPRYRSRYFQHIFAGAGYAAGYYSYLWAELVDADTSEWFVENGGLDRDLGDRFRAGILAVGGSRDILDGFRELRGRDPEIGPLLRRHGLDSGDRTESATLRP
ncbi:M3 family metallopeptidase [Nakamurella flava]|uniref:M3 family metallopeptidase n=1 Tax=Nakamurella flava TaxID=2576308 RepID=A0A4U6QCM2_9ACTN|nr:M3 family metallopeptidase [Nakamurella flava]TKV57780.1 M3 family metallopeptidase [Nakamurella flava]